MLVGLFIVFVGLIIVSVGLFIVSVGLFIVLVGLFIVSVGLFIVLVGLFLVSVGLFIKPLLPRFGRADERLPRKAPCRLVQGRLSLISPQEFLQNSRMHPPPPAPGGRAPAFRY